MTITFSLLLPGALQMSQLASHRSQRLFSDALLSAHFPAVILLQLRQAYCAAITRRGSQVRRRAVVLTCGLTVLEIGTMLFHAMPDADFPMISMKPLNACLSPPSLTPVSQPF